MVVTRAGFDRAAVVIPAHNEAAGLPKCLKAVLTAARRVPGPVQTIVVLDACSDASAQVVSSFGPTVQALSVDARNVGAARAAGFDHAQTIWAESATTRTWYATTDADSCVDRDWLTRQMTADADMVLGVVRISNWRHVPASAARRYLHRYRSKTRSDGGHNHIHGANMGFAAEKYWQTGGFAPLPSGEDVDLVCRFEQGGFHILRDAGLSVVTSARAVGKAPNGFAANLRSVLHRRGAEDSA
jgi:glycosyltransferase involved in cell wall biosynthesis